MRTGIVDTFVEFHKELGATSMRMRQSLGRCNHITPRHYTDFIKHYLQVLQEKRDGPSSRKPVRVLVCAPHTRNPTGQSRVTLSLQ